MFESPWASFGFNVLFTILGTLALLFLISFFGWSSKQYLGEKILKWVSELIAHIPVVRSVYSALGQLMSALSPNSNGSGSQFSRVVWVEYPRPGIWTIGFVTSQKQVPGFPEKHLHLYVPTTPNPTSGFYLLVKESEVRESGLKVEDAFKLVLSLGIAQPRGEA